MRLAGRELSEEAASQLLVAQCSRSSLARTAAVLEAVQILLDAGIEVTIASPTLAAFYAHREVDIQSITLS